MSGWKTRGGPPKQGGRGTFSDSKPTFGSSRGRRGGPTHIDHFNEDMEAFASDPWGKQKEIEDEDQPFTSLFSKEPVIKKKVLNLVPIPSKPTTKESAPAPPQNKSPPAWGTKIVPVDDRKTEPKRIDKPLMGVPAREDFKKEPIVPRDDPKKEDRKIEEPKKDDFRKDGTRSDDTKDAGPRKENPKSDYFPRKEIDETQNNRAPQKDDFRERRKDESQADDFDSRRADLPEDRRREREDSREREDYKKSYQRDDYHPRNDHYKDSERYYDKYDDQYYDQSYAPSYRGYKDERDRYYDYRPRDAYARSYKYDGYNKGYSYPRYREESPDHRYRRQYRSPSNEDSRSKSPPHKLRDSRDRPRYEGRERGASRERSQERPRDDSRERARDRRDRSRDSRDRSRDSRDSSRDRGTSRERTRSTERERYRDKRYRSGSASRERYDDYSYRRHGSRNHYYSRDRTPSPRSREPIAIKFPFVVGISMRRDGRTHSRRVYVPDDKMTVNEFVEENRPAKVDDAIQCITIDDVVLNVNEPIVPALLNHKSRVSDGTYEVIFILIHNTSKW